MGYDFVPRNKDLEAFYLGAFSWPWMLDAGLGLVIGTGPATKPGSYIFHPDEKGRSPRNNDGYRVSASDAKKMADIAEGIVFVERYIGEEWAELSEDQRLSWERRGDLYRKPIRKDFLDKAEQFAVWARQSKGFRIW